MILLGIDQNLFNFLLNLKGLVTAEKVYLPRHFKGFTAIWFLGGIFGNENVRHKSFLSTETALNPIKSDPLFLSLHVYVCVYIYMYARGRPDCSITSPSSGVK